MTGECFADAPAAGVRPFVAAEVKGWELWRHARGCVARAERCVSQRRPTTDLWLDFED